MSFASFWSLDKALFLAAKASFVLPKIEGLTEICVSSGHFNASFFLLRTWLNGPDSSLALLPLSPKERFSLSFAEEVPALTSHYTFVKAKILILVSLMEDVRAILKSSTNLLLHRPLFSLASSCVRVFLQHVFVPGILLVFFPAPTMRTVK